MINKVVRSAAHAVENIKDGSTICLAGFYGLGMPTDIIQAILEKGVKDLTIVAGSTVHAGELVTHNRVKKFIVTLPKSRIGTHITAAVAQATLQYQNGEVEIEIVPQATLIERVRASAAGVEAFYTTVGVGTELCAGKEVREIDGKTCVLEHPIKPDVAIARGDIADRWGNVCYQGFYGFAHDILMAANFSIVQADNIVPLGKLQPNQIRTPGIFVDCVVPSKVSSQHGPRVKHDSTDQKMGDAIGRRIANDIPDASVVELGFGLPWLCLNHLQQDKEIMIHSEGILGVGAEVDDQDADSYWRGADGRTISLKPGASTCSFGDSFNMISSGRIDYALLGAFQVGANGDFAGWKSLDPDRLPAVGASMELAQKSKNLWIVMKHLDNQGRSKILPECTYPVTAKSVVKRIYTDLATLEVTTQGLRVLDIVGAMSHNELEKLTGVKLLEKEV